MISRYKHLTFWLYCVYLVVFPDASSAQALSPILEIRHFAFVIDLAALASRREYLNLEKWLQDRINEHQLEFILV